MALTPQDPSLQVPRRADNRHHDSAQNDSGTRLWRELCTQEANNPHRENVDPSWRSENDRHGEEGSAKPEQQHQGSPETRAHSGQGYPTNRAQH